MTLLGVGLYLTGDRSGRRRFSLETAKAYYEDILNEGTPILLTGGRLKQENVRLKKLFRGNWLVL